MGYSTKQVSVTTKAVLCMQGELVSCGRGNKLAQKLIGQTLTVAALVLTIDSGDNTKCIIELSDDRRVFVRSNSFDANDFCELKLSPTSTLHPQ